jgi:RimJ/RimL family protein N-acetyltransferase
MSRTNELGQPIGDAVPGWTPRPRPGRGPVAGRYCRLEALDPGRHARNLFEANTQDTVGRMWTYMGYGPFERLDTYTAWAEPAAGSEDPLFHAIVDQATGKAVGVAAYLRVEPGVGVIEVGHIAYSPILQRTPAATEAMYLLMRRVFDELGYRRYEWKCDALSAASRGAAERLGFTFEGIFRQATLYKGRNRDTAWYSVIDREWPQRKAAFEAWLDPSNFDGEGRQRTRLVR